MTWNYSYIMASTVGSMFTLATKVLLLATHVRTDSLCANDYVQQHHFTITETMQSVL